MQIQLVSHASVIVQAGDVRIWTDPWLAGKAFNESWSLYPPACWDPKWLDEIAYLWISHEHPDHFHIPTLRALPSAFKERVTVLFQRNNSDKMFDAFRRLGFREFRALPHRKTVQLTPSCDVYCYQEGLMNSCLAVRSEGRVLVNVNDAEIRTPDCKLIRRDIGTADVVLNQFSLAGYSGMPERERRLTVLAHSVLEKVARNHLDLGARTTIPFASFVYFSTQDNRYMNDYANGVRDVVDFCRAKTVDVAVLYPGDVFDLDVPYDSAPALARFDKDHAKAPDLPYDPPSHVPAEELKAAFEELAAQLHHRYAGPVLRLLQPVVVHCPDINARFEFSVAKRSWRQLGPEIPPHLVVNSQPLHFAFKFPFGVQTLGVSARCTLLANEGNWKRHRILFSLNNAEVFLRLRYFLSQRNLEFITSRMRGGASQLRRRLATMV